MSGNQPAWLDGPLQIHRAQLNDIYDHAVTEYPSECCGFIAGDCGDTEALGEVTREVNEADKYHALDPGRFPRTSKMYFKINELRASRAFEAGAQSGSPIKVIYHSHCDAGAYFSEEDAATFAQEGQLMWPCQFLVVSVREGKVADHKLWKFDAQSDSFVASTLEVVDD